MATLEKALPFVLEHEGGFVNDPDDPGGATNFGITMRVARLHGINTVEDLKAMSRETAGEILGADYWRFDLLDQRVATKLFDMAVNFGRGAAIRLAQNAMNRMGGNLVADGFWGPKTEASIAAVDPDIMVQALCDAAAQRYRDIVSARPSSAKFLKGWLARAEDKP